MELVRDPRDFLAQPMGRCFVGRRQLVFAHSPELYGHAGWGKPDADDVREALALCAVGLRQGVNPHRWLVDLRGLEAIVPSTFGPFVEYVQTNAPRLTETIVRQAQIRPPGLVGAVISGFSHIAKLPYPERVFSDLEEAIAWLGVDREVGLSVLAEIDAIRNDSLEVQPIVARLRKALATLGPVKLNVAARHLALSGRSLQRALGESGTSYRGEIAQFQIHRAKDLLADDRETLSAIAGEVGYSSLQHFSTAFRRATGESPGAYRTRIRPSTI